MSIDINIAMDADISIDVAIDVAVDISIAIDIPGNILITSNARPRHVPVHVCSPSCMHGCATSCPHTGATSCPYAGATSAALSFDREGTKNKQESDENSEFHDQFLFLS
jgi:hypothetical protein